MLDLLIINGSCPDYEAGEMVQKNIGVKDGKIAWIGAAGEELPEKQTEKPAEHVLRVFVLLK